MIKFKETDALVTERGYAHKKCKNCGHERQFHASLGGITQCDALLSRVPKKFCVCKKFEEVEKNESL